MYQLDPKNTTNRKGTETTKYNRKPASSLTSGTSMSRSSQGRRVEPGRGAGSSARGGLARREEQGQRPGGSEVFRVFEEEEGGQ